MQIFKFCMYLLALLSSLLNGNFQKLSVTQYNEQVFLFYLNLAENIETTDCQVSKNN